MRPPTFVNIALASVWVLTSACRTLSASEQQPAVVVTPTAAGRAELTRVVSIALNGVPVRLADDALTHESVLIIDRAQTRDAANLPLNGREIAKPERFRLVQQGSKCLLIHERTGKIWPLDSVRCAPAQRRAR